MFLCASMRLHKKALNTHQFLESSTAGRQSSLDMLRKSSARFMRRPHAVMGGYRELWVKVIRFLRTVGVAWM